MPIAGDPLMPNIFAHRHAILPVIHVVSAEQALGNARLAKESGRDGVFLINHDLPAAQLLAIHARSPRRCPIGGSGSIALTSRRSASSRC